VTDPAARARVAAEWGVEPPGEPGTPATQLLAEFGECIRAAVVVGENPAVSKRDPGWVRRQLDALDHLTVVELAANETTEHADVVLPAAAGVEKAGTVTNLDRQIQRLQPVVDPPEGVRTDFRILCDLAARLSGVEASFDYDGPAAVFAELTRVAPTHADVEYADLATGSERWPADETVLYRDGFETPDGRAPFVSPPGSSPGEGVETDSDAGARGGLDLIVGGRAGETEGGGPADRRLRMHPTDAKRIGVDPGDSVAVSGGDRSVETTVTLDESVRQGTAFLHAVVADPLVRAGASTVRVELS
jgi:predicted molibdopterin-dependent oxidoreductase YjgC